MNKTRRNQLQKVIDTLNEQRNKIDEILCEEQEAYKNIPDNLNESERATSIYQNIEGLEDIIGTLEDFINIIEGIIER